MANKKYVTVCYAPSSEKDLRDQYPELKEVDAFKNIKARDVIFAWYWGVIYRDTESERDRIQMALREAYGESLSDEAERKYIDRNFPNGVKGAMLEFEKYNLTGRLKQRSITEKTLINYQKIADQDITDYIKSSDWETLDKWQRVVSRINTDIPELISKMESGFGLGEAVLKNKKEVSGIDEYYGRKQED